MKNFFEINGKYKFGYPIYQEGGCFTVEKLYQAFKERLEKEKNESKLNPKSTR